MDASREDLIAPREHPGYTRAEMAATTVVTRAEDPRWRWLFPVTRTTRDFFTAQFPVLLISYGTGVVLVLAAARIEGVVQGELLELWLAESVASIVGRSILVTTVTRASPVDVARKPLLRLLPLFAIMLAALHWSWTAALFIGPNLDLTTLVVLLVFVMLSIATVGLAPASPAICMVYLVPIWLTTTYKLMHAQWVSAGTVVVLLAAVAAVLWPALYVAVSGVRNNLVHSDEMDLLVAELRERNAEVEGLRSAAAQDLATRSSFFASASHDFRQRVHAMKLLTQSGLGAEERPGGSAALSRLAAVLEELETYMTEILEFARLEALTVHSRRSSVQLQQIFQRIELEFEDVAAAANVELRVRASPLILNTDSAMLQRILENLVSNAIKFTRAEVHLAARHHAGEVAIEIRDRGRGIPEDDLGHVFEAFYQGDETTSGGSHGVGLGLAIVKRLADALGYRLEVHSQPGRGTLMRVVIPLADVIG